MDGDDDLPLHLLRQCAQERRELSDVDLVHALDWVVNHEPRQLRLHREVQREEERECGRVEIARAQHRARISAFAATTVMGLEYRFDVSAHAFRDREGRNEGLLGRKTNEQVAPDGIELVVEDPPHHAASRLPGLTGDILRSEEHTSELQSLMRISYAVICLKKKNTQ